MEFLILRWSTDSCTFIGAWGNFGQTLEDIVALTGLPTFLEVNTINLFENHKEVTLDDAGEKKLEALNKALSDFKVFQ